MPNAIDETKTLVLQDGMTKRCSRCGKDLPLTAFYGQSKASDHKQAWCAECKKEYRRHNTMKKMLDSTGAYALAYKKFVDLMVIFDGATRGERKQIVRLDNQFRSYIEKRLK